MAENCYDGKLVVFPSYWMNNAALDAGTLYIICNPFKLELYRVSCAMPVLHGTSRQLLLAVIPSQVEFEPVISDFNI